MSAACWDGVSIRFPFSENRAVGPVDISIGKGERVLLLGPSGSGKSSLMLALTGLIPNAVPAQVSGSIQIGGVPVETCGPAQWSQHVAQYFQNADETLCGMRVVDEIAFALENRAMTPSDITQRVDRTMERLGLPPSWKMRRSATMSGGERQLVALASVIAQGTPLLVADEPTAHLSPRASALVHDILLDREGMESVLVIDHRLDGLITAIDRVVVLDGKGQILAQGEPAQLFRDQCETLRRAGIWRPGFVDLDAGLCAIGIGADTPPLNYEQALAHLDPDGGGWAQCAAARTVVGRFLHERVRVPARAGRSIAALHAAACAPALGKTVLTGIDLDVRSGEVLGLVGPNGAGKTTLGASLAGLLGLRSGRREGPMGGIAFQNPEAQLACATVAEEIAAAIGPSASGPEVMARWGFTELADRHPFELSFGQKRRLALATLDASGRWPFVVLDEPFAGLDAAGAETVAAHIEALRRAGKGVVVITHDMDMAVRLCDRIAVLARGSIVRQGTPLDVLGDQETIESGGLALPSFAPVIDWLGRFDAQRSEAAS